MGDMTSGGAPRIKSIVAAIQTVANAVLNGNVRTNLRRDDGTEIGTSANPLVVDIGGDVPDTMDVTKIGGNAVASGSGVADAGTLRVAVATDDVNLAGILAQLDITQSALRDALKGAGGKDFSTLETDIESILATTDVALSTRATEATLAAQLDITQSALRDALKGIGGKDLTTLQTALDAVKIATEKIDDIQDATVAEGGTPTKGVQMLLDNGTDGQFAQCDASGNLSVNLQTALPAGTNEIGGVNVVKVAGAAPSTAGKIDVLVADGDDVALGATTDVAVAAGAEGTLSAKLRLVTSQLADAVTALQAIDDWDSGDRCKVTPTAMGYVEANGDGTTADAYAAAATIDMRAHNQLKLLLANTDATNSLDYKVTCYAKHGGALSVDEVTETAAAAGAVAEVTLTEKWAQVVVQVKSTVAGTPATYAYEYIQSVM